MDGKSLEDQGESRLKAVALRFLTYHYHEQTMEAIDMLVNQLPADLPVEIPVMEDSHIVGSVIRITNGHEAFSILLETDVSPGRVRDYYDERLRAAGWQVPDYTKRFPGMHGGGFTFGMEELWHPGYCLSTEGPALKVTASELADGSTEIHLALETDPEQSPCRPVPEEVFRPHWHEDLEQPLPNLTPPPRPDSTPRVEGGAGLTGTRTPLYNQTLTFARSLLTTAHSSKRQAGPTRAEDR
jgi:hypothetical protein